MNTRNLHHKTPSPYYIYAPDYRETSSGICVLHYLCHALNLAGHEAYVALCSVVSPNLRTPILTPEIIQRHHNTQQTPITVYPEVIEGNPLNGPVVARYILNREGMLSGRLTQADEDDLFFYYANEFNDENKSANILCLPIIDSELFAPPQTPVVRTKSYIYSHRYPLHRVDFSKLPPDVEVLSFANPKTLTQLAELFKTAAVLYSFEVSAICTEAMLCGCPVIYMKGGHLEKLPFPDIFGQAGSAMSDEPDGITRARASTPQAREAWLKIEEDFWGQLENFIALTQQAVKHFHASLPNRPFKNWLNARTLSAPQAKLVSERLKALENAFSLTAFVLHTGGDLHTLNVTFGSLARCKSGSGNVRQVVFSDLPRPDDLALDIKWMPHSADLAAQINTILETDSSDWFIMLAAGDELLANGALMMDLQLPGLAHHQMVYFDELHRQGEARGASLRPDINLDYLISFPVTMARHWLFRRQEALAAGGLNPAFADALEFDLILRMIERNGIERIGHVTEPLLVCEGPTLARNPHELQTLQRHLLARGYPDSEVIEGPSRHYHVQYKHTGQPLVSILIPSKDQLGMLIRCVESLLEKTAYHHYEVLIIDNDSQTPEAQEWLSNMEVIGGQKIRILRYPYPFNFSAMNNMAAREARGEYLVLLNNDTAVLQPDWLDKLLNHAMRPEVGAVGAKLLFPSGNIQHAGVVTGLRGPADHPFIGEPGNSAGYMQRRLLDQNYSVVTAACMMVRKSVFEEVGGMDEIAFKVAYNDVDLCLKIGARGYLNVWTPGAVLLHEGSVSQTAVATQDTTALNEKRQRFVAEQDAMYTKWLPKLARDPAYNPNMSLNGSGFELETIVDLTWRPLAWRPLPVMLGYAADTEKSGYNRIIMPLEAMREGGLIDAFTCVQPLQVIDLERYNPDALVMHRHLDEQRLEVMRRAKAFSTAFKVYDLDDDLLNLPLSHPYREGLPNDIAHALQQGLGLVDRMIVATPYLADIYSQWHSDVRVVENRLHPVLWKGLRPRRQRGNKPRIGCMTDVDLHLIEDVISLLSNDVEWVFLGECPKHLRVHAKEVHGHARIHQHPAALASLDLDLALAPMEQSLFSDCKGNQALIEYGACGYPVICSDVRAYQGKLPVTRVQNTTQAWVEAIRAHLSDLGACARAGDALREKVVVHWMLDTTGTEVWRSAWLP